jgi:hypothetical protein
MSASISIEQYTATSYRPDCEYLEGVLVQRRGRSRRHSRTQAVVTSRLVSKEQQWGLIALMAPRVRVAPTRVRIPDLALVDCTQRGSFSAFCAFPESTTYQFQVLPGLTTSVD